MGGENVQCPVCTLYLHAGMNLSDHLETHPKEQVIRALVQLTISGGGVGGASAALASALAGGSDDTDNNSVVSTKKEEFLDNSSTEVPTTPITSPKSINGGQLPATTLNAISSFATTATTFTAAVAATAITKPSTSKNNSAASTSFAGVAIAYNAETVVSDLTVSTNQNKPPLKPDPCLEVTTCAKAPVAATIDKTQLAGSQHARAPPPAPPPTASAAYQHQRDYSALRYEQEQLQQRYAAASATTTISQLHQQPLSLTQHRTTAVTTTMSTSAPPSPHALSTTSQTKAYNLAATPAATALTSLQQHHYLHQPPHQQQQQQHQYAHHHHQQQQQQQQLTLQQQLQRQQQQHSHYMSHAAPPQQQQQQNHKVIYTPTLPPPPPLQLFTHQTTQHQKPPPAYGTAISQIRSQHNQNKHQHQHLQPHQHQQQQHITIHQIAPLNAALKQQQLSAAVTKKLSESPPAVAPPTLPSAPQLEIFTVQNQQQQQQPPLHSKPNATTVTPVALQKSSSPTVVATTIATHAPTISAHNHQSTSSSFAASPSVLRYAESPVAHYLERDNGDFIVQETPKHIVECIEKDNGEFSVIERIYQSPPSVLHIHDDNDEDDDGDDEADESHSNSASLRTSPVAKNTTKKRSTKRMKKLQNSMKVEKKSPHYEDEHDDDEEEFMSLSSEYDSSAESTELPPPALRCQSSSNIKATKSSATDLSNMPSTSAAAAAAASTTALSGCISSTDSSVNSSIPTSPASITTSSTNNTPITRKSKKNAITVLSDVSLNMSEYLDLVGNIFASNKLAPQRAFTVKAPVPLVKVEKEEPLDEYDDEQSLAKDMSNHGAVDEPTIDHVGTPTNETEFVAESRQMLTNEDEEEEEEAASDMKEHKYIAVSPKQPQEALPICVTPKGNNHATTSVIRMVSTSQQQQQLQVTQTTVTTTISTSSSTEQDETQRNDELKVVNQQAQVKPAADEEFYYSLRETADEAVPLMKCEVEPTRLTPQRFPPQPLKLRGPKKLIIKPKSTSTPRQNTHKTDEDNDNVASTSAAAAAAVAALSSAADDEVILIKNEPITNNYDCMPTGSSIGIGSILEQHLKSPNSNHNCNTNNNENCSYKNDTSHVAGGGVQQHVANDDDARVLLDFANSKPQTQSSGSTTFVVNTNGSSLLPTANSNASSSPNIEFPSASSMFAANSRKAMSAASKSIVESCSDEFILPDNSDIDEEDEEEGVVISSSSYSSQSATDVCLSQQLQEHKDATPSTSILAAHAAQSAHNFTDFNFLYNPASNVTQFAYQPKTDASDATNAATLAASSASSTILEDSLSAASSRSQQQQPPHRVSPDQQIAVSNTATVGSLWYQHQPTDFNAALAVECNAAVDGVGDMGGNKYLDLDTCKRENLSSNNSHANSSLLPTSASTTSSSFNAAATECSLVGGCTADALNIRTDERMPAKGEISEQESNCDIENSWSQSMYGDISARFFRTSFPVVYNQDNNNWNNDEYFPVQDLSATNVDQKPTTKSFDFRLPLEGTTSVIDCGQNENNLHLLSDAIPSTSTASKKKRKRVANVPTATVTSQEMLNQLQQQQQHQLQHPGSLLEQVPSTSSAMFMAGPSTEPNSLITPLAAGGSNVNNNPTPQRRQRKIYKCAHCPIIFNKLKDRSAHLVAEHNYVRRNRRLVCVLPLPNTTSVASEELLPTAASSSGNLLAAQNINVAAQNINVAAPSTTVATTITTAEQEDSKHGIIKIKMEHGGDQQQQYGQDDDQDYDELPAEAHVIATLGEGVDTKTEYADIKEGLLAANSKAELQRAIMDTKPHLQRCLYGKQVPTTKLATLYRMLMGYNAAKLRQDRELTEEERKAIENSIFLCYTCLTDFPSVKLYDAHLTEHPAECFTCGKKFYRWKNFSLHLKRHLGWKEFGCFFCDKKFVVRSALVEHMRMHTGQAPLKCNICGKKFKRYSNLTQHRKRHTKQIVRKKEYVCYCGEVLPSKARFLWHKETHDSKPKCCPHCCDRFVHANSLRRHIRLAHSDKFDYTEPMECPMCKQVFAKTSIKAHMATHSENTQYDCAICSKSFSTKWNLKMHSWVHANRTAKPFKCEHCPKAFVRELDFKNHINSHKQIKPYTCEYCGCKFIRKYNYMRHRREHHGHKKFTCDQCDKSFHRHYYLIEHRRIHTGERPFQCTICGKSSTTKTNHNKHLKIHHSRDPFTVEV